MRITCPTCAAQYDIDSDDIDVEGQDVQCSDCLTIWMQTPEGEVSEVRASDSLAEGDAFEEAPQVPVEASADIDDALAGVEFDETPPYPEDTEAFEEAEVVDSAPMPIDATSVIADVVSEIMPELAQEVAHSIVVEEAEEESAPVLPNALDQDDFAASLKSIFEDNYDDEVEEPVETPAEPEPEDDIDDLDLNEILGDDAMDTEIATSDAESLTGAAYDVTEVYDDEATDETPDDYTPPEEIPPIQDAPVQVADFQQLTENEDEDDQPWAVKDEEDDEDLGGFDWPDEDENKEPDTEEPDTEEDDEEENLFGEVPLDDEEDEEDEVLSTEEQDDDALTQMLNEQIAIEDGLPDAIAKPGNLEHGIPEELIGKRARVPDISKLRTTLSATTVTKTKEEKAIEKPVQRFRHGFAFIMVLAVALTAVYTSHTTLIAYLPEAAPYVETYLGVIDDMRLYAQNGGGYVVDQVQGLMDKYL